MKIHKEIKCLFDKQSFNVEHHISSDEGKKRTSSKLMGRSAAMRMQTELFQVPGTAQSQLSTDSSYSHSFREFSHAYCKPVISAKLKHTLQK